ncbi:MAG: class I SAM-dependent methyltransferase [Spirochaetales bacterium]|nr:class I SAM-dependent methyltransferase [Spirochaetales bacterium]
MRKYYEAYDDRYRQIHARGQRWTADVSTPVVMKAIQENCCKDSSRILEIGCGEGRDARVILEAGYNLNATDISEEAISFCKKTMPRFAGSFRVLDCINGNHDIKYDFIYSVAVIHMLVDDADRNAFYSFIRDHLTSDGLALICTMGDGESEFCTDSSQAFELKERNHVSGKVMVAGTTCRMVSWPTFLQELSRAGLEVIEKGLTSAMPDFDSLMYVLVRKA